MANYSLAYVYKVSDFNGLTNLETGPFILDPTASPTVVNVTDDDGILEDTNNSPSGTQTLDASQQTLTDAFDGHAAGSNVYSRSSGEVVVTEPDGTVYTIEINQLIINNTVYYALQYDVPAGSTVNITSWDPVGNTTYEDLAASPTYETYEYNQVISRTLGESIVNSGATGAAVNEADMTSMFVNDQDTVLEDNNNNEPSGQTLDVNIQNLDIAFDGHAAGGYVVARGYYEVTNTATGETGRMYQILVDDDYNGTAFASNGTYYAFSNDFNIGDGSNIVATSGLQALGNIEHQALFVCFTKGTNIRTQSGEVPVEQLKEGDQVPTIDGEMVTIRWVGSKKISKAELEQNTKLYPTRISAGALGYNLPKQDLLVSRQHRMLARSEYIKNAYGENEILIPSIKLTEIPGIYVDESVNEVEYFHILTDKHEVIWANGAPSETLLPGPHALNAVGEEAREELLSLFPELFDETNAYEPARLIPKQGKKIKRVVALHSSKHPIMSDNNQL